MTSSFQRIQERSKWSSIREVQRTQEPVSTLLWIQEKKHENFETAIKVSLEAPMEPFLDRLDTFSVARLLKITLVLLFSSEIHYLLSLRASFWQELIQNDSSFCPKRVPRAPQVRADYFLHQNWTGFGRPGPPLCELLAKRGSKRR